MGMGMGGNGNNFMGMGGNGNSKSHSRTPLMEGQLGPLPLLFWLLWHGTVQNKYIVYPLHTCISIGYANYKLHRIVSF